jgi:predicted transcriptional regulator
MSQTIPIQSLKLDEQGLTQVFGSLEARLLETVWILGEASVQDVIDHLGGDLNYKTAMTVLNRLAVKKGVLNRHKSGRAFIYTPAVSREDLLADIFDRMMRSMLNNEVRQIAVAQMIETAESVDPPILDDLNRLIQQRKEDAKSTSS